MSFARYIGLAVPFALTAGPALAHAGSGAHNHGLFAGFMHPIGGLDHVLAMVAVGLFASLLGGRARWAVPASFIVMMVLGGALGMVGGEVPAIEVGITLSIIVLGAVVALGKSWSVGVAMALVGVFAVFHGYAHGTEMPAGTGALAYSVGFAVATTLLHVTGLLFGLLTTGRYTQGVRVAGAATAVAGILLAIA